MNGAGRRLLDAIGSVPGKPAAAAVLLVAACLAGYAGSPLNGFVLDDHPILLDNPLVTEPGRAFEAFTSPYQGDDRNDRLYRPLTVLTLAGQWAIHGPAPWAYHAFNVLMHVLATLLAWALARVLLPSAPFAALVAGLLFAVHPIHTDAVSSVVNRSEVLAAVFVLAAFLSWRRWLRGGGAPWILGAAAAYLASVLSKESGAPLLAFAAAWAIPASNRVRRPGTAAGAWAAAFLVPAALYLALRAMALDGELVASANRYFASVGRWETFLTMAGVGARYLALMVVPYPLSPDYSFESIPVATSALEPWTLAGLLALPALVAATAWFLSRRSAEARGAGFGLLWFGLFLAPAANVVPLMIPMAERITYVATAGGFAAAALALAWLPRSGRLPGALALAVVLAGLAAMTSNRDRAWRDDGTLAADVVTAYPRNALMWANLGAALANEGRAAAAVGAFRHALDVAPGKWEFRVALAGLLHDSGYHADEADLLVAGFAFGPRPAADVRRACDAVAEARPGTDPAACAARLSRGAGNP